jgi:tRNA (cmo5U34)-methyltransferase
MLSINLNNGYTPDEIMGKSKSLKGILEPFSTQGNLDLLKRAGFVDFMTVMKYVCFEGFLAIK